MAQEITSESHEFDQWLETSTPDYDELPVLPVLALRDSVMFPHMMVPLLVGRERSIRAVEAAMAAEGRLLALAQLDEEIEVPEVSDLYRVGTEVVIGRKLLMPDGSLSIWVQGQRRVQVAKFVQTEPHIAATVEPVEEVTRSDVQAEALKRAVLRSFHRVQELSQNIPEDAYVAAVNAETPGLLADLVASVLGLTVAERQEVLANLDCYDRLKAVQRILAAEQDVLELENQLQSQVQQEIDRGQREYFLREQMRVIQSELGEGDPYAQEVEELRTKLAELELPDEVRERADKELSRLSGMSPMSPETGVIRTYLDWIIALPWGQETEDNLDIARAKEMLEASHYGIPKAKERILEHIAVYSLARDKMKNPILCFAGPPGTGKTSLGRSIAEALGRKFVRVSLGGIRDEAEIRGHRRTYVGALPGRIIQTIRRAGSANPVFMLDEIDKLGMDFRGDPASALLEVLDPEQNNAFSDHYLELPFDLSHVMFITTANYLDPVPPALLDRMEVIEFPGYMEYEKVHIARKFLIPQQIEQNGLEQLRFSDGALQALIREHTNEAGVRNLDRLIATVCRKAAMRMAEGKAPLRQVSAQSLTKLVGPPRYTFGVAEREDQIGVATGLAWTEAGGDTMSIEVSIVAGKGSLLLTGQLGDVMQESAQAALSYARSRAEDYGFDDVDFDKIDIHVHVPEGAVPKDGPSAGITIATALISALSGRAVDHQVTMTGEITLRGRVLPIGGLREKALAAHRAGLKTILVPKQNDRDMVEVPRNLMRNMRFVFVENMDQVVPVALRTQADQRARNHFLQ
jgi:ATP-dependent Lon protease